MAIKSGYKQTDVGMIPEEWGVKKLGELCTFTQGVQIPQSEQVRHPRDGYIRYLYIRDFFTNDFEWFVRDQYPSKIMAELDIMMVNTGSTAGMVYTGARGVLSNNAFRIRFDKAALTRDFLFTFLTSPATQETIRNFANAAAQPHVGHKNIAQVPIGLPEIPEQRAIAETLSDVDALLGALDRLITKKRDFKQAAMQQLLTGQTRVPGFHGEWQVKRLGELGSTYGGLTGKTKADFGEGSARYITFMNIMSNVVIDCGTFEQVQVSPTESQNRAMKGDLFFNGSSETPEEVAMCSVLLDEVQDVYLNSFCFGFRFREEAEADGLFLAYYLRSKEGRELMKSLAQGSTRYNLSKVALLKSPLRLPSLPEQTAIAEVLTDMDAELAALEQQREKTSALKQAMMQELLTGRIRLI